MGEPETEVLKGLGSQVDLIRSIESSKQMRKLSISLILHSIALHLAISICLYRKLVRRDENQKSSHNGPSQDKSERQWWN